MIDVKTIGSGSSGNCYLVDINDTKILLECGLTFKKIQKALNYKVSDIDFCLVTHEHMDHSKAVKDLMKAGIDCYMTKGTAEVLRVSGHRLKVFKNWAETKYKTTYINNILIQPLRSIHDAKEPVMYYIEDIKTKESLLFVTDTAFMAYKIPEDINTLMIECNYVKKLIDERVDDKVINVSLRNRIVKNHMSLETVLEALEDVKMTRLKKVYVLHLSDGNSDEKLIRDSIDKKLGVPVEVC
ncbi:metallo-beta-lactamase domain protein [Finegoldia magna SY403409CC001050417]|uniref:MBL fold metallo-hydrolase n=2 Tax=Finegoldia magna TaxID=1260 RepID=A0A7D4FHA0_FINMA|nr:MBL fold metallo-hydrolase [Finegoldia magna]EGS34185.1 metallo-beta-lactamase domain protein [Finegoldia magna SY403409CC001050417]QKH79714.1 MBL fold metallo-hydrolase [Finegoldia magna]